ncbi:hypothetical protein NPIL_474161 [Nephila pilipes]|uniref:Uncharacterized protein n=2 Tax=Nephila pilipes TaxID=299642 RepID=A0A8X6QTP1_NEPPI|nr:hypothetical protein NPIL_413841 [Nephila pilipes]GFU42562.1 hypothetical protein NPIL_474161 [Nephila pilipes]
MEISRTGCVFEDNFKKIDRDLNFDNHDKYAYLAQAMEKGSSAEELIKSFLLNGENYEKAHFLCFERRTWGKNLPHKIELPILWKETSPILMYNLVSRTLFFLFPQNDEIKEPMM